MSTANAMRPHGVQSFVQPLDGNSGRGRPAVQSKTLKGVFGRWTGRPGTPLGLDTNSGRGGIEP